MVLKPRIVILNEVPVIKWNQQMKHSLNWAVRRETRLEL